MYTDLPVGESFNIERRRSPLSYARTRRREATKLCTARLTATLSMAARSLTSIAERFGYRASTAITRHSEIVRPNSCSYAVAMLMLTMFVTELSALDGEVSR